MPSEIHGGQVVIAGAGSFATTVAQFARSRWGLSVKSFAVDPEYATEKCVNGIPIQTIDHALKFHDPVETQWLIGIVDFKRHMLGRVRVVERVLAKGHSIRGIIDPRAEVDTEEVDSSAMVLSSAVVFPFAVVGQAAVIGAGAIVGHHSFIGDCCYLSIGVRVCGNARIGHSTFIGAGAIIRDGISIGERCIIGAGAVILANVPDNTVVLDRYERSSQSGSEVSGLSL